MDRGGGFEGRTDHLVAALFFEGGGDDRQDGFDLLPAIVFGQVVPFRRRLIEHAEQIGFFIAARSPGFFHGESQDG